MLWLALVFSSFAGGALFVGTATAVRGVLGPEGFSRTKTSTMALPACIATGLLFLGALRALISAWWKTTALASLRSGLGAAILWLLIPMAALGLGLRAFTLFFAGALSERAQPVAIGALVVPVFVGATAYLRVLWRARRLARTLRGNRA